MSSESIPDSSIGRDVARRDSIPFARQFFWSLRRELWESRSIWIAPIVVAAVTIFGYLIRAVHLPGKIRAAMATHSPMELHDVIELPFDFAAGVLMFTTLIVAVVYSIDALYGERRDRSILFWKSMPVSDLMAVAVKATIPIVILPLLTFVVTFFVQLFMAVIGSAVVAGSGLSAAMYWNELAFVRMSLLLLYHLVAVHAIGWAPAFAWLLLVSVWSRRVPYLWAIVPPLAIGFFERIAFGTSEFSTMLGHALGGLSAVASTSSHSTMPMNPMTTEVTPGAYLASPGLWIGLALTAVFLAAAVRLRRSQSPG